MMTTDSASGRFRLHRFRLHQPPSGREVGKHVLALIAMLLVWPNTPGPATDVLYAPGGQNTVARDVVYYTETGFAEFTSRVPLHTFTGRSDRLTGMIDLEENLIDFYLDLNSLKTGIGRRDRDMYRTLNVDEHPFAEFTGSLDSGFNPEGDGDVEVTAAGQFTISGVTREVRIDGTLTRAGDGLLLEAEWIIDITDYRIEPPGILFYRVNDEQEVRIRAELLPVARSRIMN
jgi:polyisoprenoid-binding protein YceI